MQSQAAITVKQLYVSYGGKNVLANVSFTLPKAKLIAVVGPNGAGKSTLIKAMLGLIKPLAGTVLFGCERSSVAYVPQRSSIDWDFPISVMDVVLMGLYGKKRLFGWITKEEKQKAQIALETVGLDGFARRQISELSGGEQQRVFIARALMQEAQVYLMDEPFAAIDASGSSQLLVLFRSLCADGKTLVVVHHNLFEAKKHFDYALLLAGKVVSLAPVAESLTEENIEKAYGKDNVLCIN